MCPWPGTIITSRQVIRRVPQDLPAFLNWTTDTLDTRRGAERHQAAAAGFGPAAAAALIDAAGPLGLLETAPPALPGYDATVVLGGTVTGNRLRVALAASLPLAGVAPGLVVALAAHRPLTVAEISAAAPHPVDDTTEWQHLFRTACDAFGAAAPLARHRRASDFQYGHRPASRRRQRRSLTSADGSADDGPVPARQHRRRTCLPRPADPRRAPAPDPGDHQRDLRALPVSDRRTAATQRRTGARGGHRHPHRHRRPSRPASAADRPGNPRGGPRRNPALGRENSPRPRPSRMPSLAG